VPVPDVGGPEAPGPFSLADPGRIDEVLTRAGFEQVATASLEARMRLGENADDAVEFLGGTGLGRALLESVDPGIAQWALDAVREALRPSRTTTRHGPVLLPVGSDQPGSGTQLDPIGSRTRGGRGGARA
jgi:hypothetical protein